MSHRTFIAAGAAALAGLGLAGAAGAAPVVTGVDVTRTGKTTLRVDVETERGEGAARPRLAVSSRLSRVNRTGTVRRTTVRSRARVDHSDWTTAAGPEDAITSTAILRRVRQAAGTSIRVRVRACDSDSCVNIIRRVSVADDNGRDGRSSDDGQALPALPPGAVDADRAVAIALATAGPGSTLMRVEREDEHGAAWEVRARRADGARVKVYVAADGAVVRVRVDARAGGGAPPATPPVAGGIDAGAAAGIALDRVGAGSTLLEVKREDDPGVAFEVKVRSASGQVWEVEISPTGAVVRAHLDD